MVPEKTQEEESQESQSDVVVEEGKPQLRQPPQFAVILHNDDYTTMDFVIEILNKYFYKTGDEAMQLMLLVHQNGQAVAGVYQHQIAETKVVQVHEHARSRGFPLKCSVESLSLP
jgi:ATP-dependent Clp protease adaptor protein ClpS